MNRDDIKEFLEIAAGYKKSSRMLAEAEDDEDELFDEVLEQFLSLIEDT